MESTISPMFILLLMVIGLSSIISLLVATQSGFQFKRELKETDGELDIRMANLKSKRKIDKQLFEHGGVI
ncbi:MAG: hypothetical protein P9L88_02425 [Candidatus Tantalella remota]|nr:hypothetical protein [Candidatus Tantalella remota]